MLTFSTLWPAVGATGALITFVMGYRMSRSKASEYLDATDLILLKEERRREAAGRLSPLERLAGRFVPRVRVLIGRGAVTYLQRQIEYAGRPTGVTVDGLLRKIIWWLLVLVPVGLLFLIGSFPIGALFVPLMAIMLPLMRIGALSRKRRESLDTDLPEFLDILAVTVSSGISFRLALLRVVERFAGPISEEVRLTLDQLGHGASIRVAFTNMQRRTGSDAMRVFVTAFLQAEELGAPLAETLNQIATDMRRDHFQSMRRKAAQTAPRVALVTSLLMVPAALIVLAVGLVLGTGIDLSKLVGALK